MNQFENTNKMHSKRRCYKFALATSLYCIVVVVILIFFLSNPRVSTLPFADGFESGDSSAWNDGIGTSGTGSVSFVQSPVYNGSWAAKFQVTKASPNNDWAEIVDTFGNTNATVYFRAYVQVTTLPASGEAFDLLEFNDAYHNAHALATLGLGYEGGTPKWQLYYLKDGGYSTLYAGTPTANEWHCLELMITVDASNGAVKGYVDGVLILSDSGFKNNDHGNAGTAVLGLDTWLGEGYPNVAYFDCAIISNSKQ